MSRILIVEDEPNMRLGLMDNLEFEGYQVDIAEEGNEGLNKILEENYNLILLDVMLPNLSGFDILKKVRQEGIRTPIILVTAKGEEIDKVRGLEMGADDYITKPFSLRELLARVKAVLRRPSNQVTEEEIRVLSAIMFTDIVGYTALMGKDESKAMEVLDKSQRKIQPLVEKYNGSWLKEMGDGYLSSFRSVMEAVNCALSISKGLKDEEFKVRIGIHVGDVIFKGGDVFGDGVNIASRIQSIGQKEGIYISEVVYDNVKNKKGVSTESLGEKSLKNVEKPIKIFKLTP